uniref:Death domain-containing protein n=1 Tax=Arion vulgaris TaxID=1028688 RepID=A0A0B7AYI6_9EUPU
MVILFHQFHIEPNTEPKKAPVSLNHNNGPVDNDLLMSLAVALGDEWKRVAHYLGVHRVRLQAIMRNVTVGERSERDAKYDMLVTWLKGAAKALDKVSALSSALKYGDRYDLAEAVHDRNRDFIELKRGQLTAAN